MDVSSCFCSSRRIPTQTTRMYPKIRTNSAKMRQKSSYIRAKNQVPVKVGDEMSTVHPVSTDYLAGWTVKSLVFGDGEERLRKEESKMQDIQRRWVASNRWAIAAQFALAASVASSHSDLLALEAAEGNNILRKTKDAVIILQNVLVGKHYTEIDDSLTQYQVPPDRWWSSLYKVIEGLAMVSRLGRNRLQQTAYNFENNGSIDWDQM